MKTLVDLLRVVAGSLATMVAGLFQMFSTSGTPARGKHHAKALIACGIIVLCFLWILLRLRAPSTKVRLDGHENVGRSAVTETMRIVHSGGVVVVAPEDTRYDLTVETQLKGFLKAAKQQKLTVLATERIPLTTQQRVAGMTSELYFKLIQKYKDAAAIVSFIGVGTFGDDELSQLPTSRPKLVSVSQSSFPPRKSFQAGLVQVAIGPRFDRSKALSDPKTEKGWFDRYFQIVTLESAANLPR